MGVAVLRGRWNWSPYNGFSECAIPGLEAGVLVVGEKCRSRFLGREPKTPLSSGSTGW
jgi:hypothetical protein